MTKGKENKLRQPVVGRSGEVQIGMVGCIAFEAANSIHLHGNKTR